MKKSIILFSSALLILSACVNNPEGEKAETSEATETVATTEGKSLNIDTAASEVRWHGKKVTGEHYGVVDIKSGSLLVTDEGKIAGGNFVIDMNSIDVQDMEAGEFRDKLSGHLRSPDFFDVENHSEAAFEITEVKEGATANDLTVSGNLTIRGVTKNITFNAKASELSAESAKIEADFNIAREDWGVNYSGMQDDLISKEINFKIKLVAQS